MKHLTIDERIARDGSRWRYIYQLEMELERRKTRQNFIRVLFGYSIGLTLFEIGRIIYNLS